MNYFKRYYRRNIISQKDDLKKYLLRNIKNISLKFFPNDNLNYVTLEKAFKIYTDTCEEIENKINEYLYKFLKNDHYKYTSSDWQNRKNKTFNIFNRKNLDKENKFILKDELLVFLTKDNEYNINDFVDKIYENTDNLKVKQENVIYDDNSKTNKNSASIFLVSKINSCINYLLDKFNTYTIFLSYKNINNAQLLYIFIIIDRLLLSFLMKDININPFTDNKKILGTYKTEISKLFRKNLSNFEINEQVINYINDYNFEFIKTIQCDEETTKKIIINIQNLTFKSNNFLFEIVINNINKYINKDNSDDILLNANIQDIEFFKRVFEQDTIYKNQVNQIIFRLENNLTMNNSIITTKMKKLDFKKNIYIFLDKNKSYFTFLNSYEEYKECINNDINIFLNLIDIETITFDQFVRCLEKILLDIYLYRYSKNLKK